MTQSAAAMIGEINHPVAGSKARTGAIVGGGRFTLPAGRRHFANNRSRFEKRPV